MSAANPFTRENIGSVSDPKVAERLVARAAKTGERVMVEAGYATYAAASAGVTNKRIAEIFGKSASTVVLYRRLGKYLMVGGEPTSPTWRLLSGKSKANFKAIAAVIDGPDVTVEAIDAEVKKHFTPDGKSTAPVAVATTPAGETPPLDEALAILKRLRILADGFDAEAWSKVETALNTIVSRKVKALAAAAEVVPAA